VAVPDSGVTHLPDGVDLADSAAIPLIALTGDQLVTSCGESAAGKYSFGNRRAGQRRARGSAYGEEDRRRGVAGVRKKNLDEARSLGVAGVLAIDDEEAIAKFRSVDAIADTVGGAVAVKLLGKVKQGGSFGYAAALPEARQRKIRR